MAQEEKLGHTLTKAGEDYLECIWRLSTEQDPSGTAPVRSVDVAERLSVSKASVNKALTALRERGMVEQNRYGRVLLTDEGRYYGRVTWQAHRALRAFLVTELGVDFDVADEEACLMEHALSNDTLSRWIDYLAERGVSID